MLAKEEASVLEACAEWDRNWSGPSSAPSRSVVAAFGRLSAEARGAMADVLAAEYNYHYHFGSCRRQGVRERRRGVVAWAEGMVFSASTTVLADSTVPLIGGPTTATVRTTASEEAVTRALPVA